MHSARISQPHMLSITASSLTSTYHPPLAHTLGRLYFRVSIHSHIPHSGYRMPICMALLETRRLVVHRSWQRRVHYYARGMFVANHAAYGERCVHRASHMRWWWLYIWWWRWWWCWDESVKLWSALGWLAISSRPYNIPEASWPWLSALKTEKAFSSAKWRVAMCSVGMYAKVVGEPGSWRPTWVCVSFVRGTQANTADGCSEIR